MNIMQEGYRGQWGEMDFDSDEKIGDNKQLPDASGPIYLGL